LNKLGWAPQVNLEDGLNLAYFEFSNRWSPHK
jgi:hypothetical protein